MYKKVEIDIFFWFTALSKIVTNHVEIVFYEWFQQYFFYISLTHRSLICYSKLPFYSKLFFKSIQIFLFIHVDKEHRNTSKLLLTHVPKKQTYFNTKCEGLCPYPISFVPRSRNRKSTLMWNKCFLTLF